MKAYLTLKQMILFYWIRKDASEIKEIVKTNKNGIPDGSCQQQLDCAAHWFVLLLLSLLQDLNSSVLVVLFSLRFVSYSNNVQNWIRKLLGDRVPLHYLKSLHHCLSWL
jgi:hypothetical protein